MSKLREAVIVSAVRTPIGKYGGVLAGLDGYELGGLVVKEAVKRAGINPEDIEEVYMGNAEGAPGNIGRVIASSMVLILLNRFFTETLLSIFDYLMTK